MSNKGFALVTMLMVVSIVGVLTAGSLILSVTNLRLSRNDATASQALGVAQAGSAYWRAELVSLYMHMVDNFDQYRDDIDAYNSANPNDQITCGNFFAIGVDTNRDGTPDIARNEALPTVDVPVGDQTGTAVVTFSTRGSAIVLDARGAVNGARARMVDEFRVSALDVWNNAVFAGNSAANATISGRAEIRGSVHVLGDGLTSSDIALDLSGSFAHGNTYRNLNASIDPTGTDNPMRLTNRDPADLCATMRVKRGYVELGGSGQIGFAESTNADPFIDPMQGIFTNDGINGGTLNENVFSVNGMTAAYDAGNTFQFPGLDETNPDTGATWRQGLRNGALVLSLDTTEDDRNLYAGKDDRNDVAVGAIYLTPGCFDTVNGLFGVKPDGTLVNPPHKHNRDSTAALASGFFLDHGVTPDFTCAKKRKNSSEPDETIAQVIWDLGTNVLYIGGTGGVVNFRSGDLLITGPNSTGTAITYRGDGVFFAEDDTGGGGGAGGDIELEVDFLPAAGKAAAVDAGEGFIGDGTADNTYPATSILALLADETITSRDAQTRFTVAIYAENQVNVAKQTVVAGSIVTRTFDAGSNVPTVLYVPNLAERLPDLIPGGDGSTFAVSNVSFSRR